MIRYAARFTTLLIGVALLAPTSARAQQSGAPFPIGWLSGCWILNRGARTVEEIWMSPRGGTMLGTSRTVNAGRMTESEFVTVVHVGDTLQYKVLVGKQPVVTFSARAPFGDEIVFENLQHDFPKRVAYKRVTRDSVEAWIDGGPSAGSQRVAYAYHRQACGAQ